MLTGVLADHLPLDGVFPEFTTATGESKLVRRRTGLPHTRILELGHTRYSLQNAQKRIAHYGPAAFDWPPYRFIPPASKVPAPGTCVLRFRWSSIS